MARAAASRGCHTCHIKKPRSLMRRDALAAGAERAVKSDVNRNTRFWRCVGFKDPVCP
jgi:hypothetical protein